MPRLPPVLAALLALTLVAYWQVGEFGFVGYDDPSYVRDEPMVNQGLRSAAVAWAFTSVHGVNWHPLTSLSHMLDCTLFDVRPGPMHLVNLGWHLLNTALVFLVWRRFGEYHRRPAGAASAGDWSAAVVAALFALHPLHVESVAWISERKDVLSTAFWLLAVLAYTSHHRTVAVDRAGHRRAAGGTLVVLLSTALALMAKPMAVTLPFTLLLLDYWPLRRWPERSWGALVREKVPLFLLVVALSIVVYLVQDTTGATGFGASLTLGMRLGNAAVSYVRYIGQMLWPAALSPFYPHPGWWPWWAIAGSLAILAGVSLVVWRERVRRPWLLFGWCWYLGTLVPVIGLVQVGSQSIADRYTYVPLLGLFTMLAWGAAEIVESRRQWRTPVAILAALLLAACVFRTARQVRIWREPIGLIEHMRATIGEHPVVYREMATALLVAGRPEEEAMAQYRRGREIAPDYPFFLHELGNAAARQGRFDEARALLERARALTPRDVSPLHNLAAVAKMQGRFDEAGSLARTATELGPRDPDPRRLLAEIFTAQGRLAEARTALLDAVRCNRWDWLAWNELGALDYQLGRYSDAEASLVKALWINPGDELAAGNLAAVRAKRR
jgi:protein O-mannosyl-transferase